MRKELIILKIGGSVLTFKDRSVPALRREHALAIGRVLARTYDPTRHSLILIHGAGSFGHLSARRYGLKYGTKDHLEKLPRALENKASDQFLNNSLTRLWLSVGLPVAGINTSSSVTNQSGVPASIAEHPIAAALSCGAIPLLHGDMVFDTTWGMSICSGDVLAPELAKRFKAKHIFYATDVAGIFTRDPHRFKDAQLIPSLDFKSLFSTRIILGHSHTIDVTGGLLGKMTVFKTYTLPVLQSIAIFDGRQPECFSGIFNSSAFRGTRIRI